MKLTCLIATFLFLGVHSNVLQLNDLNFNYEIQKTSFAFVSFTTTWCGHSKNLQPEFFQTSEAVGTLVTFFNVDCEKGGGQTCQKVDIKYYPTLLFFKNGQIIAEYLNERNEKEMQKFIQTQLRKFSNFNQL